MKIKAIGSIIEWDDGRMVVNNPGETGELSDPIAKEKIAAGLATAAGKAPARTASSGSKTTKTAKPRKSGSTSAKRAHNRSATWCHIACVCGKPCSSNSGGRAGLGVAS